MLTKANKQEWSKNFKEKLQKSSVTVFADYRGLEAASMDVLRKRVRDKSGEVKVLKNNLARKAVEGNDFGSDVKGLFGGVVGPTLVAFSYGDVAALAKVLHEFAKENEAFDIKDSLLGTRRVSAAEIEQLASLPPREVLLAKLLGTMNAPISNFVGVLAAVPRSLLNVLKAVEEKKTKAGA